MTDVSTYDKVLEVLRGQSPGYEIYPNAAAFAAVGVSTEDAAAALDQMHFDGIVSRGEYEVVMRSSEEILASLTPEQAVELEGELPPPEIMAVPTGYILLSR